MFFCLMNFLSLASCGNVDETVVDTSLLRQTVPPHSFLQCLQCSEDVPGCYSVANSSRIPVSACELNQPHCMVRRVETAGVMTSFERRCATDCTPGCSVSRNQLTCTSCCNASRCNLDNAATTWSVISTNVVPTTAAAAILVVRLVL